MTGESGGCDPELVGRFFDGEVDATDRVRIEAHVAGCPSCRRLLEGHRAVGDLLRSGLDQALTGPERAAVEERVVAQVRRKSGTRFKRLLAPKRLIPLAAATAVLLFALTFFSEVQAPAGPSAIVTSFRGDYSSVMIMETPETRSTIIWFDETT